MKPVAMPIKLINEDVMLTASPGVGGDYDPSQGIDAKKNNFFDEELNGKWPSYNLWDELLLHMPIGRMILEISANGFFNAEIVTYMRQFRISLVRNNSNSLELSI